MTGALGAQGFGASFASAAALTILTLTAEEHRRFQAAAMCDRLPLPCLGTRFQAHRGPQQWVATSWATGSLFPCFVCHAHSSSHLPKEFRRPRRSEIDPPRELNPLRISTRDGQGTDPALGATNRTTNCAGNKGGGSPGVGFLRKCHGARTRSYRAPRPRRYLDRAPAHGDPRGDDRHIGSGHGGLVGGDAAGEHSTHGGRTGYRR